MINDDTIYQNLCQRRTGPIFEAASPVLAIPVVIYIEPCGVVANKFKNASAPPLVVPSAPYQVWHSVELVKRHYVPRPHVCDVDVPWQMHRHIYDRASVKR